MTNIRIYQIAQAVRVPSIEVLATAKTLGFTVRSSSSSVEPLDADAIASRVTGGHTVRLLRVNGKVHMLTRKGDIHNNVDRRFMLLGPLEKNPEDWNGSRRTWLICEDLGLSETATGTLARYYRCVNLVTGEERKVRHRDMTNCW